MMCGNNFFKRNLFVYEYLTIFSEQHNSEAERNVSLGSLGSKFSSIIVNFKNYM